MAHTLAEIRKRVTNALRMTDAPTSSDAYPFETIDRAFVDIATELILASQVTKTVDETLTLTDGNPYLDTSSITGFRSDRLIRASTTLSDQGTWSGSSVSYAVDDLVVGDGSPDAYFYRCRVAHTSEAANEPPNATYWERVGWAGNYPARLADFDTVSRLLNQQPFSRSDMGAYREWPLMETGGSTTGARPDLVAFLSETKAYFHPVPDRAYPVRLIWRKPLTWSGAFTPGTASTTLTQNIPDEWISDICRWGVVAMLVYQDPGKRHASLEWGEWQRAKTRAIGKANSEMGETLRDPAQY